MNPILTAELYFLRYIRIVFLTFINKNERETLPFSLAPAEQRSKDMGTLQESRNFLVHVFL